MSDMSTWYVSICPVLRWWNNVLCLTEHITVYSWGYRYSYWHFTIRVYPAYYLEVVEINNQQCLLRCGSMQGPRFSSPMPFAWEPWLHWGATTNTNTTATGECHFRWGEWDCSSDSNTCQRRLREKKMGTSVPSVFINNLHDICVT